MAAAERVQSIDWFRVIVDLERSGFSHERIALECMRSKGWVNNLKCIPGTEPRHRDGVVLLAIWSDATGKKALQAPRMTAR